MKGGVEADAGEGRTEICEQKQRKTVVPGNTCEEATREEKINPVKKEPMKFPTAPMVHMKLMVCLETPTLLARKG